MDKQCAEYQNLLMEENQKSKTTLAFLISIAS